MKILSQIYVGDNKFLLSLLGNTKDLSNLPTEYAADDSRFLNTDSNAVYVYTSADGWEITEAGQMKDLPVVSATDNGKVLKVANGVWSIGTDEGGSLPANFPTESAANANKLIGFDENGEYTAKEGGSGGGQFVVTFSGVDIEAGTVESADKTLAQIAEAVAAGKQVVGFVSSEGTGNLWMPLINAAAEDDTSSYLFSAGVNEAAFSIRYGQDGGVPRINFELTELINRNNVLGNTSLIVNLTLDGTGETPVLRGTSTYNDIATARMAGKNVLFNYTGSEGSSSSSLIDCIVESNEILVYLCSVGKIVGTKGNSTDYFALNIG